MRRRELSRLLRLYLSYHLNKVVLILLGIVLIIWSSVLILETGIPYQQADYLQNADSFHQNYLEQSLFFMQLLNGVIVSFLVGAELNSISNFDPMFVSKMKRSKIVLAKILSNFLILLVVVSIEILLLLLIGLICYPSYTLNISMLGILPYTMLPLLQLLLLGEFVSILFNSYFIPILIFVMDLTLIILVQNADDKLKYADFIPQMICYQTSIQFYWNGIIYSGIAILLLLGIILLFQRKDIQN